MYKVFIFAGTREGRMAAEYLNEAEIMCRVFAATEYGGSLLPKGPCCHVSAERLTSEEMAVQMEQLSKDGIVIDATHPYAQAVTDNIKKACEQSGKRYLRVLRDSADVSSLGAENQTVFVKDTASAVEFLEGTQGNVLVTTGSKELHLFTGLPGYKERIFARVLSLPAVAAECAALGFEGQHLICMQGPFSKDLNKAMLRQIKARWMVTKESGSSGGFAEKVKAAEECGCGLVVIGRPPQTEGISLSECLHILGEKFGLAVKEQPDAKGTKVTLVGIGMGAEATMTKEAKDAVSSAELLIGAARMLDGFGTEGQDKFVSYKPEEIRDYIAKHPSYQRVAVLLSGDTGFYSGAKKLLQLLDGDTEVICGISSMIYFAGRLKTTWEDILPVSLHGRSCNIIGLLKEHPRIFALAGSEKICGQICRKLTEYGMGDTQVSVGENLSYENEKIIRGSARELADIHTDGLCVMLLEAQKEREHVVTHGISDDEFLRGSVPMTKEEVRSVSLSRLHLTARSVVYDVGAGTGSVAVEMAMQAVCGKVYAIEKNPEGVELIRQNKRKFRTDNLEVIEGTAPEALIDLEPPTHAFIGGSSGNLREILELLLKKNPSVRIVMNAITLETVGEMLSCIKELPFQDVEITSLSAARSKKAGSYHLMMGLNPVTIVSAAGDAGAFEK